MLPSPVAEAWALVFKSLLETLPATAQVESKSDPSPSQSKCIKERPEARD